MKSLAKLFTLSGVMLFQSAPAQAVEPIIRPFVSTRSTGMGSTLITTGLYEENFFGNPARVLANPKSKFTLFELTGETNTNTLRALSKRSETLASILNSEAGKNLHQRLQAVLPAWYLAAHGDRRFAIAFGVIAGAQNDFTISNNYASSGAAIVDLTPALTFGYKPLKDDSLSLGITLRGSYRFSIASGVNFLDLVRSDSTTLSSLSGDGAMYNFDLGVMYHFLQLGPWEFKAGLAGQNLLGGAFNTIGLKLSKSKQSPIEQLRSFGTGISVVRKEWGNLTDSLFAFEVRDILNNGAGSFFRLLHIGLETHWKSLAVRTGLNQGYWTAGLGADFHYFNLDFATYGEELGLNAGQQEDRRYAVSLGTHF